MNANRFNGLEPKKNLKSQRPGIFSMKQEQSLWSACELCVCVCVYVYVCVCV